MGDSDVPRPATTNVDTRIASFLAGSPHAVVGASRDQRKYGHKVVLAYQQAGRPLYVINPHADTVAGLTCYLALTQLPEPVHGISVVTPPHITEQIIDEALTLGIRHIWLQPGAESARAVERARASDANVIAGGPCVLVALRYREPPS